MAEERGFLRYERAGAPKRPVEQRLGDWREVYAAQPREERDEQVATQAARCMDCGVPFCHSGSAGCPLANLIPEWNDLARRGQWERAGERLHATNNFPEFTGKLCPAPCEAACVLEMSSQPGGPVTIERIEETIAAVNWERGAVPPQPPAERTGTRVAVVGSGPAGLAAAQQLTRAGHEVTVHERDDRLGGLLRYGIPAFKMEKWVIDRRLEQMRAEGTRFRTSSEVGRDVGVEQLRAESDAVVLAVGALRGRDDPSVPGRQLDGVHLAMPYLVPANRECEGDGPTPISATGKDVVIIGGGDTGADCYGTASRQGAHSVTQLDQYPEPPHERDDERSPWPTWPWLLRTYPAHQEGGQRRFAVSVEEFVGGRNGQLTSVRLREVRIERDETGTRQVTPVSDVVEDWPCQLALLAIGFTGVEHMPLLDGLGLPLSRGGAISCGSSWQTSIPGVFTCGDAHRGASLIVWAIAEGRSVARAVDTYLTGSSRLPAPVHPTELPLVT